LDKWIGGLVDWWIGGLMDHEMGTALFASGAATPSFVFSARIGTMNRYDHSSCQTIGE